MKLTSVTFKPSAERLEIWGMIRNFLKLQKGPLRSWKAIWEFEETLQRKMDFMY